MPRSPWLASAGWTNSAGVPVEASVADPAARPQHGVHGIGERRGERTAQALQGGGFDFEGLAAQPQGLLRVERALGGVCSVHRRILSTPGR